MHTLRYLNYSSLLPIVFNPIRPFSSTEVKVNYRKQAWIKFKSFTTIHLSNFPLTIFSPFLSCVVLASCSYIFTVRYTYEVFLTQNYESEIRQVGIAQVGTAQVG
ncbi:hypothetical protein CRJ31_08440, partial [Salmonella enterica]|nr:hypothetical protein [Salmonella enterica]